MFGLFPSHDQESLVAGMALSGVAQDTAGHVLASVDQTGTSSTSISATIQTTEANSWIINSVYGIINNSTTNPALTAGSGQTIRVDLTDTVEASTEGTPDSFMATQVPDSTASSTSVTVLYGAGAGTGFYLVNSAFAVAPAIVISPSVSTVL